jgi:hypothetical protein
MKKFILFLVLSSAASHAQQGLSTDETFWAMSHPFAALKVKKISRHCDVIYNDRSLRSLLDTFPAGGKLDAFRHVFYMAAFAQKAGIRKIRKLGRAHEKGNYRQFLRGGKEEGERPDSLSSVMDLQNNDLGLAIGCNFKNLDLQQLKEFVIAEISKGKAVIMKRNSKAEYTDCSGEPLRIKEDDKKWNVAKCLVRSDFSYKD